MANTGIPYLTKGWNFYVGCKHQETGVCPVPHCWARGMNKRFHGGDFTPRLIPERLLEPLSWKQPQRIGVCFTGDLMGNWVDPEMAVNLPTAYYGRLSEKGNHLNYIVKSVIESCPQHTFLLLTKAWWNLRKWIPFPDNAWVGVSVCNERMFLHAMHGLDHVEARIKYLSFEPLMEDIGLESVYNLKGIQLVILGGFSRYSLKTAPKIEWIRAIVQEADRVGAKVWIKDNLRQVLIPHGCSQPNALSDDIFWASEKAQLRQELP